MFNKMKKMVAGLLATIMITTNVCPMFPVRAASGVASLESLGKLGTVNIGSKSESGTWLQTQGFLYGFGKGMSYGIYLQI